MTASETGPLVRWLVLVLLGAATVGMVIVSLRANYFFGYGLGQSEEKAQVFGWANVAADLWKVSGLIVITSLWRGGKKQFALLLMPVWALCLLWGLIGALGVYAQDRTTLIGGRDAKVTTLKDAEREVGEIEAKLKNARTTRTVAEVEAAIVAVLARPVTGQKTRMTVGKLSADCTTYVPRTTEACLEVARLREERAAAEEVARLGSDRAQLRALIRKLRDAGGSLPVDPVAELLAWLSRGQLNVHDIGFGFPLVFAILIELVSAFGPAGLVAFAEATRQTRDEQEESVPRRAVASFGKAGLAPPSFGELGLVATWMADRTEPTIARTAIGIEELYSDYEIWCLGKSFTAASLDSFENDFDHLRNVPELEGRIRKFTRRYFGIRLISMNAARIADL